MAASEGATPNEVTVHRMWKAHREDRIDDMLQLMHPGVQWRPYSRPGPNRYLGHEGIRKMVHDIREATGPYSIEVDRITETGPDIVSSLARVLIHDQSRDGSTMAIEFRITLTDGLVDFVEALTPPTDP